MRMSLALAAFMLAAPATAEVTSKQAHGFEIRHKVVVAMPAKETWDRLIAPAQWWSDAHTYSSKAANMTLEAKPGGCFCERLPGGGGVAHLTVAVVQPGKRLTLTGGLGPLLYEGVAGVMDIALTPAGTSTEVVLTYRAGGFARANAAELAGPVDAVLGEQLRRLAAR